VFLKKSNFVLEWTEYEARALHVSHFGKDAIIYSVGVFLHTEGWTLKAIIESFGVSSTQAIVKIACYFKSAYLALRSLDAELSLQPLADLLTNPRLQLPVESSSCQTVLLNALNGQIYAPRKGVHAIVIAGVKSTALHSFVERCEGIKVEALELGLLNNMAAGIEVVRLQSLDGNILFMSIGAENAFVWIINKERVVAIRALSMGIKSWVSGVRDLLNEESELALISAMKGEHRDRIMDILSERLGREIEAFVGFYELESGSRIQKMGLFFPSMAFEPLIARVANSVGIELIHFDVNAWVNTDDTSIASQLTDWGYQGLSVLHLAAGRRPT
jgi:hypothetical protein